MTAGPTASLATRSPCPPRRRQAGSRRASWRAATLGLSALLASGASPAVAVLGAQQNPQQPDTATRVLSIGDAARLAARQSATAQEARAEAQQATAETHLRRGSFLPTVYGLGQETELVENSAA